MKEILYVWYSPEWNIFNIATKESGYVFENEFGKHHLSYRLTAISEQTTFYLICKL